jgi:hypothetical protein
LGGVIFFMCLLLHLGYCLELLLRKNFRGHLKPIVQAQ